MAFNPPTPRPRHPARVRAARRSRLPPSGRALLESLRTILCEPIRAEIVQALSTTELTVGDLAQVLGRSDSATSQHLRVLRQLGVVRSRRSGRLVYNTLADDPLARAASEVLTNIVEVAARQE